ncbi:synaptotagmin [Holotrichia oblita]|uniref:Synaptotagmin n=1 Tax=Holotrichia oblita TaxID=644536 RepID=A0ACB9TAX8_HOLOL|nr:synaptotagmin [Holotrichia oblita]
MCTLTTFQANIRTLSRTHKTNLNIYKCLIDSSVPYDELKHRYIQFSVYDFDRFSRHDLIGHVVLKGLLDSTDLQQEIEYTMNILCPPQLAFKFAVANKKKRPEKWDENSIAGEEWMRFFMQRHSKSLSIRKPEATSLSRCTSFNKTNINCFFNNLEDVHRRFGPIPPERIWNTDALCQAKSWHQKESSRLEA